MPQNIYDDPDFFDGYSRLRAQSINANNVLITPNMRDLIGTPEGLRVLDMGCGTGEMCRWLAEQDAASVTGFDVSERMLQVAAGMPVDRVTYMRSSAEQVSFEPNSFDLVISTLMFHYLENISPVLRRIRNWLSPSGRLVFCCEHPIMTAGQGIIEPGWVTGPDGEQDAWTVTRYADEGKRVSTWFVDGVVKYHRTTATIVNSLIESGFRIERMLEPHVAGEIEAQHPELLQERHRPAFLFISAEVSV